MRPWRRHPCRTAGPDNFVFANVDVHAAAAPPVTYVVNYSVAEGDSFDFSALTSQFHATGIDDALIVQRDGRPERQVRDAAGRHHRPNGLPSAPNWVSVPDRRRSAGDAVS